MFNGLRYYSSAAGYSTASRGHPAGHGICSVMFGFFDSFNKGCGCALGVVTGLVIALVIVSLFFVDAQWCINNWCIRF